MGVIRSYGIAAFDEDGLIILIERPYSYEFIEWTSNLLNPEKSLEELKLLTDKMTETEKRYIIQYKIATIADMTFKTKIKNNRSSVTIEQRFQRRQQISYINMEMLKKYVEESTLNYISEESKYDIPKGRLKLFEDPQTGALREFEEETGISRNNLKLINIPPYIMEFSDNDINYEYIYYYAQLTTKENLSNNIKKIRKNKEVANMHLLSLDQIKYLKNQHKNDFVSICLQYMLYSCNEVLCEKTIGYQVNEDILKLIILQHESLVSNRIRNSLPLTVH